MEQICQNCECFMRKEGNQRKLDIRPIKPEFRTLKVDEDGNVIVWTDWQRFSDGSRWANKYIKISDDFEVLNIKRYKNYNNSSYIEQTDDGSTNIFRDHYVADAFAYEFTVKSPVDVFKFIESIELQGIKERKD